MAKITFDAGDGSPVQEFDVVIAAPVVAAAPTITEVDVKESDGSEVITAPEAPLPPAPTA